MKSMLKFAVVVLAFAKLSGEIPPELNHLPYAVYPDNPSYNTDRLNFNKRWNVFPYAIFHPENRDEIRYVLNALKQNHLSFSVRSGGHCYEAGSLSPDYIIDLSKFTTFKTDPAKGTVTLGAGLRLNTISDGLALIDCAIPMGTCPTNGISGFSLGGGIGYLGRPFGLGCDSVKNITLLTAEGNIIEVNETSYPDLFWALRGGGNGSYGIVLEFVYQMYHIPAVTYYELKWAFDKETFPEIFSTWQTWVQTLPSNISTIVTLDYENGESGVMISGLKIGADPFTEWEAPFAKLNPNPMLYPGSFASTKHRWIGESSIPFNKGKSKILMEPISEQGIEVIAQSVVQILKDQPNIMVSFDFEAYGGAITQSDSAFAHKNGFGWLYQSYYWHDPANAALTLRYSQQFYDAISPYVSKYSYPNTVDYDLGSGFLKAYYGDHAERLIEIKKKYDPENIFHWTQSIPL